MKLRLAGADTTRNASSHACGKPGQTADKISAYAMSGEDNVIQKLLYGCYRYTMQLRRPVSERKHLLTQRLFTVVTLSGDIYPSQPIRILKKRNVDELFSGDSPAKCYPENNPATGKSQIEPSRNPYLL